MRILSGLAGKMAPVAGSRGKAVPTSPPAFTPLQHRVMAVTQWRQSDSRGVEVQQQQAGTAHNTTTTTTIAPRTASVESQIGRGNNSCSGSCSASRDSRGSGATSGSCTMARGAAEQPSPYRSGSNKHSGHAGPPSRTGRGTDARQSTSWRDTIRDPRGAEPSRKDRGTAQHPAAAAAAAASSGSSRSRVREYRKRVCVRWGSLQWSLALVVVVRSAAGARCCQHPTHHHHHHHAVTTTRPLTVA